MAVLSIALVASGCSSSKKASTASGGSSTSAVASSGVPALSGSINVLAASSLTGTFTALGKSFQAAHPGVTVTFNFGSSGTLSTQITQGAPSDVFASAATKNMNAVGSAADASNPTNFVNNTMEIAVPTANPAKVTSLADPAKSGVRSRFASTPPPCGATAEEVFTNAKLTIKPVTQEAAAKTTISKVTVGEADAAVVYLTDVKAAIDVTASRSRPTSMPRLSTRSRRSPTPNSTVAAAFVANVLSITGQKVLSAGGFESPQPLDPGRTLTPLLFR